MSLLSVILLAFQHLVVYCATDCCLLIAVLCLYVLSLFGTDYITSFKIKVKTGMCATSLFHSEQYILFLLVSGWHSIYRYEAG